MTKLLTYSELREQEDIALTALEDHFTLTDFIFSPKTPDYAPTAFEATIIEYFINEWDYGYEKTPLPPIEDNEDPLNL